MSILHKYMNFSSLDTLFFLLVFFFTIQCVVDDERLSLLDAETRAPAWPRTESNLRATGRVGGTTGRTVSAPPSTSSLVLSGGGGGGGGGKKF